MEICQEEPSRVGRVLALLVGFSLQAGPCDQASFGDEESDQILMVVRHQGWEGFLQAGLAGLSLMLGYAGLEGRRPRPSPRQEEGPSGPSAVLVEHSLCHSPLGSVLQTQKHH